MQFLCIINQNYFTLYSIFGWNHLFVAWFNITASIIFIQELPPILLILFPEFFLFHSSIPFMKQHISWSWISGHHQPKFSNLTAAVPILFLFLRLFDSFSLHFLFMNFYHSIFYFYFSSFLLILLYTHSMYNSFHGDFFFSEGGAFLTHFFPFILLQYSFNFSFHF